MQAVDEGGLVDKQLVIGLDGFCLGKLFGGPVDKKSQVFVGKDELVGAVSVDVGGGVGIVVDEGEIGAELAAYFDGEIVVEGAARAFLDLVREVDPFDFAVIGVSQAV